MKLVTLFVFIVSLANTVAARQDADLFALIGAGDADGLEQALAAGADPNERQPGGLRATPLMWVTGGDDPRLIDILLAAGAEVDLTDAMGDPAINWAAYYGHVAAIERLLDAGADTDLTGHGNAVEIVMRRGHQAALRLLLEHRGELPVRGDAETAFAEALAEGNITALDGLSTQIDLAAARDFAGRPAIQAAARNGAADSLRWLASRGYDVDRPDAIGFSALFEAAREGQAGAVAALIDAGADVNRVSQENALSLTPLHLAAIGGESATVSALLDAGADPDAQGLMGGTALMWAAFEGSQDAARILLERGANAELATEDGTIFAAIASQRGWTELLEFNALPSD
ncbi:ankyrin repeat domain-containing protein [Hyphobacterium sp.]|uniref:ankyrin repeat domain-containing protein n=1 Tax=Hyphobacterium sp. TaxID=2004662 RepID=UPI003BA8C2DC